MKTGDNFTTHFLITEDIYEGFIQLFNDKNPLHTNEQFAIDKGFKGKVMHGNILNGFLSYFIGEWLPEKNVIIHSQEIQYKNPVYLNDELQFSANISGIYQSVNVIEFKFTFKNSESKTVAKGKIQIGILK
jgi:3-hydroxybutyryl-CoA dehydratase